MVLIENIIRCIFYPAIDVICDRTRPVVYTIAIYGKVYMTRMTSHDNIAKLQMAAMFSWFKSLTEKLYQLCHNIWIIFKIKE